MDEVLMKLIFGILVLGFVSLAVAVVAGCTASKADSEWKTRVIPEQCEINRRKLISTPTKYGPVSYRNITPAEMVACGLEPMPNDVCESEADCVRKAAKKHKEPRT